MGMVSGDGTGGTNGPWWGSSAQEWATIQEGQFVAGFHAVLNACDVGAGTAYLDAGCGAGLAAQLAARRGASVAGFDAAEALLEIAQRRVPSGEFHVADLERMPFDDDRFDVVTGFNAFQFAGDPGGALAEARRVTKPGGVVAVMTWGEPEGMDAASIVGALGALLPAAPAGSPGPFSLSDESTLRAFAVGAGLEPIEVVDVESPWRYPDLDTAIRGLGSSGVAARAASLVGRDAVDAAHRAALEPFVGADGSLHIGAACRYLVARA